MPRTANKPVEIRTGGINSVQKQDLPVHGWYRFVLSFPPHLVRQYLTRFGLSGHDLLLDPFCGTGTTLVEAKKEGIPSLGCDAHPFAVLVSRVKTNWTLNERHVRMLLKQILRRAEKRTSEQGLAPLSFEAQFFQEGKATSSEALFLTEDEERLLPMGFLSRRPLQRLLILRDELEEQTRIEPSEVREFFYLSLAHVIANGAGNFAFGPEIYRTKAKPDYDVLGHFARHADLMLSEMASAREAGVARVPCDVHADDARVLATVPGGISAVITSPPYPNEKDYTRTTRVELILLRLVADRAALRGIKESLLRSNTRNVFVDDEDGKEVEEFASIQRVCEEIESRRVELGKDSGFERLYHKVVAHYFGGMRRHFRALRGKLLPGARLAYVVGDQLSFLMVPVPTAKLLSEVAASEGFKTTACDLWRERIGTKIRNSRTKEKTVRVREEVLVLTKA